jgi:hypothetical protein
MCVVTLPPKIQRGVGRVQSKSSKEAIEVIWIEGSENVKASSPIFAIQYWSMLTNYIVYSTDYN